MTHTTELLCKLPEGRLTHVTYRNHRGETAIRLISPTGIHHGSTEHHPEPQYLLHVFDLDRRETRLFALRDILVWHGATRSDALPCMAGLDPLVVRLIEEHGKRIAAESEVRRLQALIQVLSREHHTDSASAGTVRFVPVPEENLPRGRP